MNSAPPYQLRVYHCRNILRFDAIQFGRQVVIQPKDSSQTLQVSVRLHRITHQNTMFIRVNMSMMTDTLTELYNCIKMHQICQKGILFQSRVIIQSGPKVICQSVQRTVKQYCELCSRHRGSHFNLFENLLHNKDIPGVLHCTFY